MPEHQDVSKLILKMERRSAMRDKAIMEKSIEIGLKLEALSAQLDAAIGALGDGANEKTEKLIQEGISNLMNYDGAPKEVR